MKKTIRKSEKQKATRKTTPARSNGKHPGGRPSLYNDDVLKQSRDYLVNYSKQGDMIPSIAGLSVALGVCRDTLYAWSADKEKTEFSDILKAILSKQELVLINSGLTGDFNPTIVKLVLGKHGYTEKKETELTGADGGPIKVLNADIKNLSPKEAERAYHDFAKGN
jgi:hypothetical protein